MESATACFLGGAIETFWFAQEDNETVQNLGVVTPHFETDAGANSRLRHAHGGGVPRPIQTAVYGSTCWHWAGRAG
jgi:hypothetical protein